MPERRSRAAAAVENITGKSKYTFQCVASLAECVQN
jgi:hypothetical protein